MNADNISSRQNFQLIEEVEKMFDGYNKEKTMGNSRQQVRPDKQGDMTNINN
jgi:hypothetical protein